jgi:ABC-type multidrug transport system ATPase subunit
MQEMMVKAEAVSKTFDKAKALEAISFGVARGELMGFLGPDGSGKTTLFRILASLLLPSEGRASMAGFDVVKDYRQIRKITGYMPGRFSLYQDLSVAQNLKFYAAIFGVNIAENYYLIKDIYSQLEPFKHRLAGKLSGGMKQKLALSCALIHKPKILILDEPTTGVDAISRKEFWQMLKRLQKEDITILVSTPYMDEAGMCDRVALFQDGRIMANDKPENIPALFPGKLFSAAAMDNYLLLNELRKLPAISNAYLFGQSIHFVMHDEDTPLAGLAESLTLQGIQDLRIGEIQPGVEDCFISLMKQDVAL